MTASGIQLNKQIREHKCLKTCDFGLQWKPERQGVISTPADCVDPSLMTFGLLIALTCVGLNLPAETLLCSTPGNTLSGALTARSRTPKIRELLGSLNVML